MLKRITEPAGDVIDVELQRGKRYHVAFMTQRATYTIWDSEEREIVGRVNMSLEEATKNAQQRNRR